MNETAVQPFDQRIRYWMVRVAFLACLPVILLGVPVWWSGIATLLKLLGTLLIIAAILYRFWAILYIGGRKNQRVVQEGPYSMSRHPLYFGTTLGALGFGLMLGSILLAALFGALTLAILVATAAREERFLRAEFGPDYEAYASRVPNRVLPVPGLFTTPAEVTFVPKILRTNGGDALGFLLVLPLVEVIEWIRDLHLAGAFPIF
ncbi:isoprenylcysteine carboxylmethyltransferase family protein [Pararhodobacter sp.]|uniref:methyltransferase family protein n=1 Tax=Pararhodobacter sp. TaxID=2127056 RepID=UPI002AFF70C7|nr:isoprenylcysteine carboxylmethyltransferase family protein [Pararhodobacter sp.]